MSHVPYSSESCLTRVTEARLKQEYSHTTHIHSKNESHYKYTHINESHCTYTYISESRLAISHHRLSSRNHTRDSFICESDSCVWLRLHDSFICGKWQPRDTYVMTHSYVVSDMISDMSYVISDMSCDKWHDVLCDKWHDVICDKWHVTW